MTSRVSAAFFALLRSGLGLASLELDGWWPLSEKEWHEVHALAGKHTVLGVVFDGMEGLPAGEGRIPMPLFAKWALEVEDTVKSWRLQHAIVKAQKAVWEKRGMKAAVLKGQTVAAMYPHPERRTSGDIDWWFGDESDWRTANEIAAANAGSLTEDSDGDVHYVFKGEVIEHHRRWNDASSRKARKALAGLSPDTPVAVLVMLELHILKHAMVFGVGLRQVCDLVMAYRWFEGKYEASELEGLLERCGLGKWDLLLNGLLRRVFGDGALPEHVKPGLKVADKDVEKLFALVMADGNFGLEAGRRTENLLRTLLQRAGLFVRYTPREFAGRLMRLAFGRLIRKKKI